MKALEQLAAQAQDYQHLYATGQITASEFSKTAGTIPWEALCSITKRVARVYVGAREV